MSKVLPSIIPFFTITGMTLDELIDEAYIVSKREKQEEAKRTQKEFLSKKERRKNAKRSR